MCDHVASVRRGNKICIFEYMYLYLHGNNQPLSMSVCTIIKMINQTLFYLSIYFSHIKHFFFSFSYLSYLLSPPLTLSFLSLYFLWCLFFFSIIPLCFFLLSSINNFLPNIIFPILLFPLLPLRSMFSHTHTHTQRSTFSGKWQPLSHI